MALLDLIFSVFFFDFWNALGAQEAPKGAPRSAKATKMVPKVIQKGAKSDFERVFFEISETLTFDDSAMIFMVFWCPGGSLRGPKTKKKHLQRKIDNKNEKTSTKASKITRKNAPKCPKSAKSTKKYAEGSRQGPPRAEAAVGGAPSRA